MNNLENLIAKDDISEESFKFRNGLADFENEFKFIGEFFAYQKSPDWLPV